MGTTTSLSFAKKRQSAGSECGQATILLAGVLALAVVAMVLLASFGQAVIHRAQARNAADAVALAAAVDPLAADELRDWYQHYDISVHADGAQAVARSGPAQAAAWASSQASSSTPAPALVAIVARAEQLLDTSFSSPQWSATTVTLHPDDAASLRIVAVELSLCEQPTLTTEGSGVRFELC